MTYKDLENIIKEKGRISVVLKEYDSDEIIQGFTSYNIGDIFEITMNRTDSMIEDNETIFIPEIPFYVNENDKSVFELINNEIYEYYLKDNAQYIDKDSYVVWLEKTVSKYLIVDKLI